MQGACTSVALNATSPSPLATSDVSLIVWTYSLWPHFSTLIMAYDDHTIGATSDSFMSHYDECTNHLASAT